MCVHAYRSTERESLNFALPPLVLAWLPSNETLPMKLSSLPKKLIAPVLIDQIKGTILEPLCGKHAQSKSLSWTMYGETIHRVFASVSVVPPKKGTLILLFKSLRTTKHVAIPSKQTFWSHETTSPYCIMTKSRQTTQSRYRRIQCLLVGISRCAWAK